VRMGGDDGHDMCAILEMVLLLLLSLLLLLLLMVLLCS
jgi:hypothetical protein